MTFNNIIKPIFILGKSELENSRSKLEHFFELSRGLLPQDFKSLKEPIDARSAYKIENSGNNSENRDINDDTATANDSEVMDIFENTSYENDRENEDLTADGELKRSNTDEGAKREGKSFRFNDNSGILL